MSNIGPQVNPFDVIPYPPIAHRNSLPHRMAAVGQLFGMRPHNVQKCRVLELGCATGMNIIAMADMMPDSQFVGIDNSRGQIRLGQELVDSLGLNNVILKCQDILDLAQQEDQYDYIIAHGVYSWVPEGVRNAILKISSSQLAPDGIAYVGYNTYPGWHARAIVRDVMKYRTSRIETPAEQLIAGRSILRFLAHAVSPTEPHAQLFKAEIQYADEIGDAMLYDHLGDINHPVYFHEFVRHASDYGLKYLGEARLALMSTVGFGPTVVKGLQAITGDPIESEQYLDFLRNRMFRSSLLCHQLQELNHQPAPDRLAGLFICANVKKLPPSDDTPRECVKFLMNNATATVKSPSVISILEQLESAKPGAVAFEDLIARRQVDRSELKEVGNAIIQMIVNGAVDVLSSKVPCIPLTDRPRGRKLAQLRLKDKTVVTFQHENVALPPGSMIVLSLLDGVHDRQFLVGEFIRLIRQGRIRLETPTLSVEQEHKAVSEAVDTALGTLAVNALLAG